MERLAREKIATQQRLAELKHELSQWMDVLEIDRVLRQTGQPEDDQASTSTASGEPRPIPSSTTLRYSLCYRFCPLAFVPYLGFRLLENISPVQLHCIPNPHQHLFPKPF